MSTDFSQLIVDIEAEAAAEGPQAMRELTQLRDEFSLAAQLMQSRGERRRPARQRLFRS